MLQLPLLHESPVPAGKVMTPITSASDLWSTYVPGRDSRGEKRVVSTALSESATTAHCPLPANLKVWVKQQLS